MLGNIPPTLSAQEARAWWCALMDNVADLLEDAQALLSRGSHARARSLVVLAGEELGKAVWVYRAAHAAWDGSENSVTVPVDFEQMSRRHPPKIMTAARYGSWLRKTFTGDTWPARDDDGDGSEYAVYAKELNDRKQEGFYVDWVDGRMRQPRDVVEYGIDEELRTTAHVANLLIFEDWSRDVPTSSERRPPPWNVRFAKLAKHGEAD